MVCQALVVSETIRFNSRRRVRSVTQTVRSMSLPFVPDGDAGVAQARVAGDFFFERSGDRAEENDALDKIELRGGSGEEFGETAEAVTAASMAALSSSISPAETGVSRSRRFISSARDSGSQSSSSLRRRRAPERRRIRYGRAGVGCGRGVLIFGVRRQWRPRGKAEGRVLAKQAVRIRGGTTSRFGGGRIRWCRCGERGFRGGRSGRSGERASSRRP